MTESNLNQSLERLLEAAGDEGRERLRHAYDLDLYHPVGDEPFHRYFLGPLFNLTETNLRALEYRLAREYGLIWNRDVAPVHAIYDEMRHRRTDLDAERAAKHVGFSLSVCA